MKQLIRKILSPFKPMILFFLELESSLAKKWVSSAHQRLFWATWGIPKNPEFFDHHNVIVFETIYPERHNLYFWASDGVLPFSENWNHWIRKSK